MNDLPALIPGDICLYFTVGNAISATIAFAEGMATARLKVAHVEVYAGAGQSWASRDGIGVSLYPFRSEGLVTVRRPVGAFDAAKAAVLFERLKGTPYGTVDNGDNLLQAGIDRPNGTINCSDTASRIQKAGQTPQFDDEFDPRYITPRDFLLSRASAKIWAAA